MERYDCLLHHKGAFLFLLFLSGFPKILCYILGLGTDNREFLLISTVGRFAGTVLLTLGKLYPQPAVLQVLLLGAVVAVFYQWHIKTNLKGFQNMAYHIKKESKAEGIRNRMCAFNRGLSTHPYPVFVIYVRGCQFSSLFFRPLSPLRAPFCSVMRLE